MQTFADEIKGLEFKSHGDKKEERAEKYLLWYLVSSYLSIFFSFHLLPVMETQEKKLFCLSNNLAWDIMQGTLALCLGYLALLQTYFD